MRTRRAEGEIAAIGGGSSGIPATGQRGIARLATAVVLLLVMGILGACGPDEIPPDTGVRGRVLIGPTCPVVRVGTDCPDRPFPSALEVRQAGGRIVAHAESDDVGGFEIALPPGDYVLVPAEPNPGVPPYASPIPFTVAQGVWTTLTVQYDSGIR